MRVVEIDFRSHSRWEAFVDSHPDGLIYHHPLWLQALEREYGVSPLVLACENAEGELVGILPLQETRGLFLNVGSQVVGRRLASLPRTPVAGPLAVDRQATAALVREAVGRIREAPGVQLQLKVQSADLYGLLDGLEGAAWRPSYVLDLPEQPNLLRFGESDNHAKIRRKVNRAARLGVQVREAQTEDELLGWYRLYLDTMREHVMPPRPYRFFTSLWELLRPRGRMRLLLAEQTAEGRSRMVAGSVFLTSGQTFIYAFNGRSRKDLSLGPNDAIQWQAIHAACREGYRRYDMGEVADENQGLAYFKKKWGTRPIDMHRFYYPASCDLGSLSSDGRGRARRALSAAWRRLPLRATEALGDLIFGYL